MLDGFWKPKFYSKCKKYAQLTKMRLDTIMKKRNAVQKFLKKDIADLLSSSLDYNAYGRAEGLLVEQNMSSCYELISKNIGIILENVRNFDNRIECPDECKEAVPSLMYAAARFSDLPELRDLRTLFRDKYANSLEPHLCKELVHKLKQYYPTKEMKIQLLRDLAQEFAIPWDSKALELRLNSQLQGQAKRDPLNEQPNGYETSSLRNVSDENELVPPPYVKQQEGKETTITTTTESEIKLVNNNTKPKPRSMRTRFRRQSGSGEGDEGAHNIMRSISTDPLTMRGKSLPIGSEKDTVITRATSLETTLKSRGSNTNTTTASSSSSSSAVHVHPNLPDYDDLSARLAALTAK